MMLKQWPTWVLVMALAGVAHAAEESEAGAQPPEQGVREMTERLLEVLQQARGDLSKNPQGFYTKVESILEPHVDFQGIARAVMASYYEQATPQQRERFAEKFKSSLVRSYGRALIEFDYQSFEVLPVREEHRRGNRALVRMRVTGSDGTVYPLHYYLTEQPGGGWQIKNVVVNGVNLGLTYRNQFASAIQSPGSGGIEQVINSWSAQQAHVRNDS